MATEHEVAELAEAMGQLLCDMAETGVSVCGFAKAKARIAFEPFRDEPESELGIMPLDEAVRIMVACDVY